MSYIGTLVKLNIAEHLFDYILIFDSLHLSCSLSSCSSLGHVDLVMEDPLLEKWEKGILKQ